MPECYETNFCFMEIHRTFFFFVSQKFVLFRKTVAFVSKHFNFETPNGNRKLFSYKTLSLSKHLTILCFVIEKWIGKELSLLKHCVWWHIWNLNLSCYYYHKSVEFSWFWQGFASKIKSKPVDLSRLLENNENMVLFYTCSIKKKKKNHIPKSTI